jgi:hypothetical protein
MNVERYVELLGDPGRAGVYRMPSTGASALRAAARQLGWTHFQVRLRGVRDKAGFLDAVARSLAFPNWFGRNWDALEDCLTDLSWHEARGFVVSLAQAGGFCQAAPEDFGTALHIFEAAAQAWREEAVGFWTLVDIAPTDQPDLTELR